MSIPDKNLDIPNQEVIGAQLKNKALNELMSGPGSSEINDLETLQALFDDKDVVGPAPASGSIDPSKDGPEPDEKNAKSDDEIVDDLVASDGDQGDDDTDDDDAGGDDGGDDDEGSDDDEGEVDFSELLEFIPDNLRVEDDPAGSFQNWVENYETLRQERDTFPTDKISKLDELEKERNRLAQELAEKNKVVARLTQEVGGFQDVSTTGPASRIIKEQVKKAEDLGVDLAKIGDLSGQEFKHDFFDEPEEAFNERLAIVAKQLVDAVQQSQKKLVEDYVIQMATEQEAHREMQSFMREHPDFLGLRDAMQEVIRMNPALDRPGGLEVIYNEAKKLRAERIKAFADEMEKMGYKRPATDQQIDGTATPPVTGAAEKKSTLSDEQKDKIRRLFAGRKKASPSTEMMKKGRGTQTTGTPAKTKKGKPKQKGPDVEQEVLDMLKSGPSIGGVPAESDPGARDLKSLLNGPYSS